MAVVLSVWDYVVFAMVLLISASIGLYYRFTGGRQKTLQEYMLANGSMSPIPVSFSLMATFMSAITLLGVSSENYLHGTQFQMVNIAYILATPIVTRVYLPVFYSLGETSVYAYLEKRFGRVARLSASLAFSIQMILYTGIVLYAPALAVSAVTGFSTVFAVLSIGGVCTFYSTIGGIKAVLITDVFQSLLMFAAVYVVIIQGSIDFSGIGNILSRAEESGRIEFFNMDMDPTVRHTFWSQLVGGVFVYLSLYAVSQAQVQRLLTVRTLNEAQWSLWMSIPIQSLLSFSTALAGLTIYAKYKDCDPLIQGRICSPDQLLPLFVADTCGDYPGVLGLFIAGLLSGSLSTVSSTINSLACITWEDYVTPLLRSPPSPVVSSLFNKILALGYGVTCIGIAFLASQLKGVLQASLTVFGVVGGPLLGLFTLGMLFPWVGQKAAVPSFLLAIILGFWMGFGGPKPPVIPLQQSTSECPELRSETLTCSQPYTTNSTTLPSNEYFYFYRISYMYYSLIGFSLTILLASILSIWFPQKGKVSRVLLSPILHKILQSTEGIQDQEYHLRGPSPIIKEAGDSDLKCSFDERGDRVDL